MSGAPVRKTPCKLCGKALVHALTAEGGKIPLDAVAPCYYVSTPDTGAIHGHPGIPTARQATRIEAAGSDPYPDAMVNHFATCPNAGEFSRSKTKAAERDAELRRIADGFDDAARRAEADLPTNSRAGADLRAVRTRLQLWKAGTAK